jgi:hypothetical protein
MVASNRDDIPGAKITAGKKNTHGCWRRLELGRIYKLHDLEVRANP